MTDEEKKEFEEFLQWKKERAAKAEEEKAAGAEPQEESVNESSDGKSQGYEQQAIEDSNGKNGGIAAIVLAGVVLLFLVVLLISKCSLSDSSHPVSAVDFSEDVDSVEVVEVEKIEVPEPQKKIWNITTSIDEMTDTKNIWAKITSDDYIVQDFPYEGYTRASITVRYMKKYGYNVLVEITQGQINGRSYYSTDYITARFDDSNPKKYFFDEAADGSSDVVFIRNSSDFIKRCKQAKDIKIDIPIYQAGRPVFTFHVDEPLVWPE